jgi:hypothetical protein
MLGVEPYFWHSLRYRLVFNRYTLLAAAIFASGITWWAMRPPANPGGFLKEAILDSAAGRIASQMPAPLAGRAIAVTEFGGDADGSITKGIRDRLGAERGRAVPSEFLDRVLRQIGLAGEPVTRLDDALRVARETGVDGVLFGEVIDRNFGPKGCHLKLDLRWAEKSTGQALYLPPVEAEIGSSMWSTSYWSVRMLAAPIWPRLLIWSAATILLPLVASPLIRRLTAAESNTINFAILAVATTLDAVFAFALLGFSVRSALPAILLIAAFAAAVYYNSVAVAAIDEYRD